MANLTHLECSHCRRTHEASLRNLCAECGRPLLVRYELNRVRRDDLLPRLDLWRYFPLLPLASLNETYPLGEGGTPLVRAKHLGTSLGLRTLYVKDESGNPTGTFKARGMAVAVPMAKALGATKVAVPSAGNAGSALAAYAARAGLESLVVMPKDTPVEIVRETASFPSHLFFVDGLITDAAALVKEACEELGYFSLATLQEPYRVEGKKTMGFELWEQLGSFPDWIVVPTGGGTGIVGLWKAFAELRALGWSDGPPPKLAFVQSAGCAPLVRAFEQGKDEAEEWPRAETIAAGLQVPRTIGDRLILQATRETGGRGLAVTESEIRVATNDLARLEGIHACFEGGAALAGLRRLVADGVVKGDERVVLFNTGTGLKNPQSGVGIKVPTVRTVQDLRARLR